MVQPEQSDLLRHMGTLRRMVVVDEDGKQGTIEAYSPPEKQFVVVIDDERVLIPADIITPGQDGSYTAPLRFAELIQGEHRSTQTGETIVIPVIEEELAVGKRPVELGRVRVSKVVHADEEVVDVPLIEDRIEIERVPMHRLISEPLSARVEGNTTIVPVMKEVFVVQKQLMLVEEVHVHTRRVEAHRPQSVTLRREEVHVERLDSGIAEDADWAEA